MNIVGYGICGVGEARRYMEGTLKEFKRLCDTAIILINGTKDQCKEEIALIEKYGFRYTTDIREWGKNQWRIKQDFLENHVAPLHPDMCICLDMDEVFTLALTREWIENAPLDAYHVFIVSLWNDEEHYKPERSFWNVRIFRWNGDTRFKEKPLHCGLAPQWAYFYNRYAPFILKHYGLMLQADRKSKIQRYEKYDPQEKWIDPIYYRSLASNSAKIFDEKTITATIEKEVAGYKQTKPRTPMENKKPQRFAYMRNPAGILVDIPERDVEATLKRGGFTFLNWSDQEKENKGSYQASTEDIKSQEEEVEKSFDVVNTETGSKITHRSRVGIKQQRAGRPKKQ